MKQYELTLIFEDNSTITKIVEAEDKGMAVIKALLVHNKEQTVKDFKIRWTGVAVK